MYATTTDLKKRLNRFYNELYADIETGVPNDDLATDDLIASSSMIDGYACTRYQIPVTAPAALALLQSWALTLSEELAFSRRVADVIPESITKRADIVRSQLKHLASGEIGLLADEINTEGSGGDAMIIDGREPHYTRHDLVGW